MGSRAAGAAAVAAAMERVRQVQSEAFREALRPTVVIGATATAAPEATRSTARQTVHQRNVTIQDGAFPLNVRVEGAELGDPEEFARRLRGPLLGHIADALETQHDLGATDDVGF